MGHTPFEERIKLDADELILSFALIEPLIVVGFCAIIFNDMFTSPQEFVLE